MHRHSCITVFIDPYHMNSSTVLNTDVCWYSWPSRNSQTHLPQVGVGCTLRTLCMN